MKQYEYNDLLQEEVENQEFMQQLQDVHQMTPEDKQSVARIRERWLQMRSASRPIPMLHQVHPTMVNTPEKRSMAGIAPSPVAKPWKRVSNRIAAVLVAALLVAALVTTFSLINAGKHGNQAGIGAGHNGRTGVALTDGSRLYMVSQQVGWAVGHGPKPYNNLFGSVLRTSDGGKHWQDVTPQGLPGHEVGYLYILDEQTAWLPAWSGHISPTWLYRTVDAGASWQRFAWPQTSDAGITFVDQNHGWVIGAPPLELPALPTTTSSARSAGTSSKPVNLQDLNQPRPPGKLSLLHTDDGGKTWQNMGPLTISGDSHAVQFLDQQTGWMAVAHFGSSKDAKNPVSFTSALYITHDGGHTWKSQSLLDAQGRTEHVLSNISVMPTFLNRNDGYLMAYDNSSPARLFMYVTSDGGNTWQQSGGALPANTGFDTVLDAGHIVGRTPDARGNETVVMLTLKGGLWVAVPLGQPQSPGELYLSFGSMQTGVALRNVADRALVAYQIADGGKTWHNVGTLPD